MSPDLGAGPGGYADYQKVSNWDGPTLINEFNAPHTGNVTYGPFDVSRYAYLGGYTYAGNNPVLVTINWYRDSTATRLVGTRQYVLDRQVTHGAQQRIANLGPFVKLTYAPATGATNWTQVSTIFATNRYHPLEFIPQNQTLIAQANQTIPAMTGINYYPSDYYAGPLRVATFIASAGITMSLFAELTVGVNTQLDVWTPAATAWSAVNIVAPPGAWFLNANNTMAAGIVLYTNAIQPMTGAT